MKDLNLNRVVPSAWDKVGPLKNTIKKVSIDTNDAAGINNPLVENEDTTSITINKEKVVVSRKSYYVGKGSSHRDLGHGLGLSKRSKTLIDRQHTKVQSILKKDDFVCDDMTANVMKEMVLNFYNVAGSMRKITKAVTIWGLSGVFFSFVQRELIYLYPSASDGWNGGKIAVTLIRGLTTFSTMVYMYYIYGYHLICLDFKKLTKAYLKSVTVWTSPGTYIPLLCELGLAIIHEPPLIDFYVDISLNKSYSYMGGRDTGEECLLSNPWGLMIYLRLYLLVRFLMNTYYTGGTRILGMWHNFDFSLAFTLRNFLHTHPLNTLLPVFFTNITLPTYLLWVCERTAGENGDATSLWDSCWLLVVTMTTVGYGDIVPATHVGRFLCVLASFTYVVLQATLIATVHQKLCLMPYESRMVEFLEHASSVRKLRDLSASVIQSAWRLYSRKQANRKDSSKVMDIRPLKGELIEGIKNFDVYRNTVQVYDRRYRNDQMVRSMLEDISRQFEHAEMYFSAANQLAAATGIALGIDDDDAGCDKKRHSSNAIVEKKYKIMRAIDDSESEEDDNENTGLKQKWGLRK